ncbi:MAG: hypothetical protein ACJ78Q_14215 [Chloroflexia bacterium]
MTGFTPLTILPLSVTIIGAAFAIVIFNHYFGTRRRPHELIWGIAFVLFALAAASQVWADVRGGWTEGLARTYYLTGAILNVALLGLGTIFLLSTRRVAGVALVLTILFAIASAYVLFTVPVDISTIAHSQKVDWKSAFGSNTTPGILAALGSGLGSIILIGGAVWSGITFWRKRIMKSRMIGVFLLAGGTLLVAAGGTIKVIMGDDHFLYPTMALGVTIMFVGYLQTIRHAPAVQAKITQPAADRSPTA